MTKKRNAALDALSAPKASAAEVVPIRAEPAKPKRAVAKVMLYLPPKVKRKIDEIAFHGDRKAHDVYMQVIAIGLREIGHSKEADMLVR